jgi:uncharacterized protein YecE (DUF72 family)
MTIMMPHHRSVRVALVEIRGKSLRRTPHNIAERERMPSVVPTPSLDLPADSPADLPDLPENQLTLGDTLVRIGTTGWSERSLTHESSWYPKRSMKAAERLVHYASRFGVTEIETTQRFPATPALAQQWVDRSPQHFRFDLRAWSLLCGRGAFPASLWDDLFDEVRPDRRDRPKLYLSHLSSAAVDECWARFRHALQPLLDAGRLGVVIFGFPRWFSPREENRRTVAEMRTRLEDIPIAVHFSSVDWTTPDTCESTFDFLEDLDVSFVCVDSVDDAIGEGRANATTNDLAVIRLTGRRPFDESEWTPDWRGYRYNSSELRELAGRIRHLAQGAREVHALVSTSWRDDAVENAAALCEALTEIDVRS